jgi:hypothetical protein
MFSHDLTESADAVDYLLSSFDIGTFHFRKNKLDRFIGRVKDVGFITQGRSRRIPICEKSSKLQKRIAQNWFTLGNRKTLNRGRHFLQW